jgi:hypothetical protein
MWRVLAAGRGGVGVSRRLDGMRVVSVQFDAASRERGCDATLVKCEYSLKRSYCCIVIHLTARQQVL